MADLTMTIKPMIYGQEVVNLYVDMSVGIGGDKWPAAELFCQLITAETWKPYFCKLFYGKSVIELGAGTGLSSILIDHIFTPREIVVTDHESHVDLIAQNLSANKCSPSTAAAALDWCNLSAQQKTFDIVLAFECVYKEELYVPFIEALLKTTDDNSLIIMGLTRLFCKPLFFDMLKSHGFSYKMIPQETLPADYSNESSGRDVGMFLISRTCSAIIN